MPSITFYKDDGRIDYSVTSDTEQSLEPNKQLSNNWIDGEWSEMTHYIVNNDAVERPICPAIIEQQTIKNLPVPCKIIINSTEYDADEPEVELELPYSARYTVRVVAFPYLDGEYTIEN